MDKNGLGWVGRKKEPEDDGDVWARLAGRTVKHGQTLLGILMGRGGVLPGRVGGGVGAIVGLGWLERKRERGRV